MRISDWSSDVCSSDLREHAMSLVANILIVLIALLHLWFLILEMFLWTRPSGRRAFGLSAEFAEKSRALAANQETGRAAFRGRECQSVEMYVVVVSFRKTTNEIED